MTSKWNKPDAHLETHPVQWGNLELPESEAVQHFMAIGATGSGKTTVVRPLMQSMFRHIRPENDRRAIVYDAKQDMLPILENLAPGAEIGVLNPFDARGWSWDVSADITERRVAVEFVYLLFPILPGMQPFFVNAVRHLSYGVIVVFMLSEKQWTLADLIRVLKSENVLKKVLGSCPETQPLVDQYFGDPRTGANIVSTIATTLLPYEPVAAAWEDAERSVSLSQWSEEPMILLMPNAEVSRSAIDSINRCIFKRAVDITLNQSESTTRRCYFLIDELAEAGRLDGLGSLLKKGRSKGASVTVTFQSIAGLRAERMYGPYVTDDILGQISNRFIGRLECPETAEWASRYFGDQEIQAESVTKNHESNLSRTWQDQVRRAVLPSELMSIPPCSLEDGISGYFISRYCDPFFETLNGHEFFLERLIHPSDTPAFIPRDPSTQYLRPWGKEDVRKFQIESPKPWGDSMNPNPDNEIRPDDLDDLFS